MATRALLLSGDEQTVQAATQVLKELDFAFEHSSELPFGTNRLAHQHFEVILVDCDEKEGAIEVFSCLRGSTLNQTSITIAIVDGKAGVPNAFRLGANLVLTKPVSLEQAKGTLRRALGTLRKEAPAGKALPTNAAVVPVRNAVPAAIVSRAIGHKETQSAHAADSPVLPSQLPHSDAVNSPAGKRQASSSARPNSRSTASGAPSATLDEVRPSFAAPRAPVGAVTPRREVAATTACAPAGLGSGRVRDDDPILAELQDLESRHAALPPPTFHTPEKPRRNKASLLVAVTVILAAAGLYAAGTRQPSFRNLVTSEYRAALRRIAEFRTKPQAIASATPAQPPPHAAQSTAAPLARPSAAQTVDAADTTASNSDSTANPASTSSAVADARVSPRAAFSQDVKRDDAASRTVAVPALVPATSTTQRASVASTEPVVLPESVADGRVMRRVRPIYPKQAQQKRVHGAVVLQVVVNKDGKVDSMEVINGNPLLTRAAVDAVRQRRYKPYFRDGEAVPFETQATVDFRRP